MSSGWAAWPEGEITYFVFSEEDVMPDRDGGRVVGSCL